MEKLLKKIWHRDLILKKLCFFACICILSSTVGAQAREEGGSIPRAAAPKSNSFSWDKVVVGGNLGLQFGTVTLVDLSPTAGYMLTEKWLAGLSARYIYYSEKTIFGNFTTNIYGGGVFTQYFFLENFLGHAEYEMLSIENFQPPNDRIAVESLLVGGGYRSFIGSNSYLSLLILWNLNDDINSPYSNPIIRMNFGIGL